jgi:undecaprenyl-diphosphatase
MELLLKAALLGVVEGITEFLPISSTGHLILVNQFINFTGDFAAMFDVVIQLGAIFSVIVYFWNRLWPFRSGQSGEVWDVWKKTIAGVIPALLIGGILGHKVEELLFNPWVVASALLAGGVVLIIVENQSRQASISAIPALSYKTAALIGLIQCLAMIPGTSRSAATIIGAMLLGCSRKTAAEFSFFLAIPTMFAASAYSLLKTGTSLTSQEWMALAVGFAVSFLVAWGVIAAFMGYIQRRDFKPFAWYRIILAVLVVAWFGRHLIH